MVGNVIKRSNQTTIKICNPEVLKKEYQDGTPSPALREVVLNKVTKAPVQLIFKA